jgi:hypothetical protein
VRPDPRAFGGVEGGEVGGGVQLREGGLLERFNVVEESHKARREVRGGREEVTVKR